jgi:hypothetical protein
MVITRLLLGMMSGLQLTHENHDVDINFISFLAMPETILSLRGTHRCMCYVLFLIIIKKKLFRNIFGIILSLRRVKKSQHGSHSRDFIFYNCWTTIISYDEAQIHHRT